jgi:hypothetical protein
MAPVSSPNPEALKALAVLGQFFSTSNLYANPTDAGVPAGHRPMPTETLPAIMRYAKGFKDRPLLLPVCEDEEERTLWIACAHDELSARGLRDELIAFIGPSFGNFEIDAASVSPVQKLAQLNLAAAGLSVAVVFEIAPKSEARMMKTWQRYWQLLDLRPIRPRQELRTFQQLRAAFDRSLVVRNEKDAFAAMSALRDQHGLSAENRAFLEIRLNAAFCRWDRILSHPQWDDLLKVRLPPETYGDIWEALYESYLTPVEIAGDVAQLISAFNDHVRIMAASLLKSRGRSKRPAALKGLLLYELSVDSPSAEMCSRLLRELGGDAFGPCSEGISAMARATQPKSEFEQAIQEMELERYEQAISILQLMPDSVQVLQAQLRCAKEIADPGRAQEVLERIYAAKSEISEAIRQSRSRLLRDIEKLAADDIRTPKLPDQSDSTQVLNADNLLVYWRELVRSSEAKDLLGQPGFVQSLIATIEDIALDSSPLFESLLPIWFDWLVVRSCPSSALVRVYLGFIEALHVRDRSGESEREMVRLAARHALIAGLTPAEYRSLVERLSSIFSESPSPREISWGLDLSDLLIVHPCRDEELRLRWIAKVLQAASISSARLSVADKCLFEFLAKESNFSIPQRPDPEALVTLNDRADVQPRIFLYSLDEQAIRRAARVLEAVFPKAKIDLNSDETCTSRLRTCSRSADWIVFVSSVATHQAFFCIKAGLRPDAALLQVDGSGTTRIVERVIRQSQLMASVPSH